MQQGILAYCWPKTSAGVRKSVHGLAAIRACFHHIRQAAAAISAPATISNSGCKIRNQECQEEAGPSNEGGKEPGGVPPVNETTRQLRSKRCSRLICPATVSSRCSTKSLNRKTSTSR